MRKLVTLLSAAAVALPSAAAVGMSGPNAADRHRRYKGARTARLNAARDFYCAGSTQYNAVAAAWSAVAVS